MIELTPDNVLDYLRQTGRIGADPARVTPFGWGVSNAVFRIETADRLFVLKQSRPHLRHARSVDQRHRSCLPRAGGHGTAPSALAGADRARGPLRGSAQLRLCHEPRPARIACLEGIAPGRRGRFGAGGMDRPHPGSNAREDRGESLGPRTIPRSHRLLCSCVSIRSISGFGSRPRWLTLSRRSSSKCSRSRKRCATAITVRRTS